MKRAFPALSLLCLAAISHAQREPIGVRVRVAYGFTPSFDADGSSRRFEGPEVAVALPIGTFLGQEILLEPSFYGGGRLRRGGDDDADVYRLGLLAHHTFGKVGVRGGVGFATATKARGGGFGAKSNIVFDFGVEVPFKFNGLTSYQPFVDGHVVLSPEERLRGYFIGIGVKL